MAPTTPVQQVFQGTVALDVDGSPAAWAYPVGALADDLVLVHTGSAVSLYRLTSMGATWLADAGDWEMRPSHVAAMDDMVVTVKEQTGADDFHLFTPGSPWTVESETGLTTYDGAGLAISGDQGEIVLEYAGLVRAYSTGPFDGTLAWACLTGTGWLVASPRSARWLRYDGTDLALLDDTATTLDTLSWAPDIGDRFDGRETWVPLAVDTLAVFYIHVPTTGSWPRPALIRYRVLSTAGDTLAWVDPEEEIDAGWEASVLDSASVVASSWFGQVACAYERIDNL